MTRAWRFALALGALLAPSAAVAADPLASVEFPVAELGGCADRDACADYCDEPGHFDACSAFAEARGIDHSAAGTKLVFPVAQLGGCESARECRAYCEEPANLVACVDFAESTGIMSGEDAARARVAIPHLVAGDAPGGCRTEAECLEYCGDASRIEECVSFAQEAGIISDEEAAAARAVASEGGPGGCRSKDACMSYCDDTAHRRECFDFAVAHHLVSDDEAAIGQRFLDAGGVGPAGCVSKQDCARACDDSTNFDACVDFARDLGVIDDADWGAAQIIRDAGGPGGCRSKEACEAYCADASRFAECSSVFGAGSRTALGGDLPPACVERGLLPAECHALCIGEPSVCAQGAQLPPGTLPPPCEQAGISTAEECARYCGGPDMPCGQGAPPPWLGTSPPTGLPPDGGPTGIPGVAAVCAEAGIAEASACDQFCVTSGLPCALPAFGEDAGGAPPSIPFAIPSIPTSIPEIPTGFPMGGGVPPGGGGGPPGGGSFPGFPGGGPP